MSNNQSIISEKSSLGAFGERSAADYLRNKGYTILEMNYRCRCGEIDIIAEDSDFLVFVEVKLRKDSHFAEAREFVTYSKQQKIKKSALFYISGISGKYSGKQARFDVIEIYAPLGQAGGIKINHIEDAFY